MAQNSIGRAAIGTYGCGRCDKRWTGLNTSHCSGCHQTFSSPSAFDAHRSGSHSKGTRHCLPPESVGLVDNARAYRCWSFPGSNPRWADA